MNTTEGQMPVEQYRARLMKPELRMTPDQADLVRRRTMPFLDSNGMTRPLSALLAEAYMQGMRDASDAAAVERDNLKAENDWLHSKLSQFASNA
jgi:hypothetical protein